MKTNVQSIIFTKEDVIRYCEAIGQDNQLYHLEQVAKLLGLPTITLPPAMPLTMYQYFQIPWNTEGTIVHRKQKCKMHDRMFIDEKYTAYIELSNVVSRNEYTFSTQTLYFTDEQGKLCFEGEFYLVARDSL